MQSQSNYRTKYAFPYVTERFNLSEQTKFEIQNKSPNFGFNGLGYLVFQRTYSRDGESWNDVVIRVVEGVLSIRKDYFLKNSLFWDDSQWQSYATEMAHSLFDMEWMPPGRGLWMMGTDFCYERGSMALYNCSAVDTSDDLAHAAEWAMDCLMNGVGVGFSTLWNKKCEIPDKADYEIFKIPDSREGWVESLITLICSYTNSPTYGKNKFPKFDYSGIRPAGLKINGFGGISSGPEPLRKMHQRVENYLDMYSRGYITKSDGTEKEYGSTRLVADIFNSIGACIVAGNVRRSAEIALGDIHDNEFLELKDYSINPERGEIGWMSNNSVTLKNNDDYDDFSFIPRIARKIRQNGEPGMINLYNIQKYGRYGKEHPDSATLVNPCGEISLNSFEVCNLAEVFPPRCAGFERMEKALKFATFYASTVSLLPTHRPETNAIIAKNRRIGVSISGIAQWVSNTGSWSNMNYTLLTKYLRKSYKIVKNENVLLANQAGVPPSIRVTTVKPSGSISLLAGVTPGIHYPVSRYAIRRVRIANDSPLVQPLKDAGVQCEQDTYSDNTLVFSFAIDHGNVRACEDVSPWEQFALVATMQRCYADNCVSATIYFDPVKDGDDVEKMLAMYIPILKSVSMLPHSGHGYAQAPYEPIDYERYIELRDSYNIPNFTKETKSVPIGSRFCTGARCEI